MLFAFELRAIVALDGGVPAAPLGLREAKVSQRGKKSVLLLSFEAINLQGIT
jgi:hypothetical protein